MVGAINVFLFIMIISFVIERVVKAILFLLVFVSSKVSWVAKLMGLGEATDEGERKARRQIIYFLIAALIAASVVWFFKDIRILKLLIGGSENEWLDFFVTWVVLLGGSDFMGRILAISGVGDIGTGYSPAADSRGTSRKEPLEVVGTIKLENTDGSSVFKTEKSD